MKVTIGDIELEAPQGIELIEPARVPSHPREKGFDVADHIALEPRQFRLTGTFFGEDPYTDRHMLYILQEKREPVDIVTPILVMTSALISKISSVHSNTHGEVKCVIELKEAKVATVSVAELSELPGDLVETPFDGGFGGPTTFPSTELDKGIDWWGWTDSFIDPLKEFWESIWE